MRRNQNEIKEGLILRKCKNNTTLCLLSTMLLKPKCHFLCSIVSIEQIFIAVIVKLEKGCWPNPAMSPP